MVFWQLYASDYVAVDREFEKAKKILRSKGFKFKGKICLELGPGNSYVTAYNMLANGARKVVLLDKFPRQLNASRQKNFFKKEIDYIQKKYGLKNLPFVKKESINKEYIEVIKGDITNTIFKQKFDLVYSVSVLEHVKNIEAVAGKLNEILKENALAYHLIDMRDHYNFLTPFLFYKYSNFVWEKYLTKEGVSYTNRLRYADYKKIFSNCGFKLIDEEITRYPLGFGKISREFKERCDLNVGFLKIVLQKSQ